MNKADLIEHLANENDISKLHAERIINSLIEIIRKNVKKGEDVKIANFGTFTKIKRKSRSIFNPHSQKVMKVTSSWLPKFRAAPEFKKQLK